MGSRTVHCAKLGHEAPGLDQLPFDGPLGEQIFANVSLEAWNQWKNDMMIKVINEYRLNLSDAKDYNKLLEEMMAYLNLGGTPSEVGNAERGRQEQN